MSLGWPAIVPPRAAAGFAAGVAALAVLPLVLDLSPSTHTLVTLPFLLVAGALAWNLLGGFAGQVSFGPAGSGAAQHLALEMFKLRAKVDALHVPYKGSGPLLTDLIGGQIQYSFDTMTAATPHVKTGRVIAIAQTRTKRAKGHPSVPTMQEEGYPGFEATTWYGLTGPGRLPRSIAQKINADVNTVLAMPDVQERLDTYGAEDGGGSAEKFDAFMHDERAKWAKVVKEAGVKGES